MGMDIFIIYNEWNLSNYFTFVITSMDFFADYLIDEIAA